MLTPLDLMLTEEEAWALERCIDMRNDARSDTSAGAAVAPEAASAG